MKCEGSLKWVVALILAAGVGDVCPGAAPPALRAHRCGAPGGTWGCARAAIAEARHTYLQSHDEIGARAVVRQSGPQPRVWVQSRRSGPRVCGSSASRPGVRDGVLGASSCPWPEHQRRDGPRGRTKSARARAEGAVARTRRDGARACLHRRTRDTLHREGRPTAGRRSRVCRCDARANEEIPARPRRGDDVCRVADGPAAMELLDAGRGTTGGDRGSRGGSRARDRIESETSRRASLLDSHLGADQQFPSGPRGKPIACCR